MNSHPFAELFPMGGKDELKTLAKSIKEQGLLEPIVTHEDMILDGRCREEACKMAGVSPEYREWNGECGSPLAFVLAKNLHRRHLSVAERALVAVAAIKLLKEAAAKRQEASRAKKGQKVGTKKEAAQGEHPGALALAEEAQGERTGALALRGKTAHQAAKQVNVSPRTVENARKVVQKGTPELQEAMRQGKMPVKRAASLAGMTPAEQIEAIRQAESQPRRKGVDEEQRKKQEPLSVRKWLQQWMDLHGTSEESLRKAHARLDEVFGQVAAERRKKKR